VTVRFSKVHGLGNDFVVVDLRGGEPPGPSVQDPAVARLICDRHFGVGADGVLAILPPRTAQADATMRVINSDGSEAEMCGNGLRAFVKHLVERDPALRGRAALTIDTGFGPLTCDIQRDGAAVESVSVEMGRPRLTRREIPMIGPPDEGCVAAPLPVAGRQLAVTAVSTGNPHAVSFVDETGPALMALAREVGPAVETCDWFPKKANVEFAHVHAPDRIELVVWERGCGITLACGTGACATVVAACLRGLSTAGSEVAVTLPGGTLSIRVAPDLSGVRMTGPARHVFDSDLDLAALVG
jgi:diaminopimelate epimerase